MALSGMHGQVLVESSEIPDEITKFVVIGSVLKKEFGHDKSNGWQDVCAGTRKVTITLDANCVGSVGQLQEGTVVNLTLYPFGAACGNPAAGAAIVDQISYTISEEDGAPVSYTATLSSKLAWTGLGDALWGGFERGCGPVN